MKCERLLRAALFLAGLAAGAALCGAADVPAAPPATAAASAPDGDEAALAVQKANPGEDKFWEAVKLFRSAAASDLAAGRARLQESADLEYNHGQMLLGECLVSGSNGFTKNPKKGASYYRLAAERGNGFAKVALGQCYCTGTGVSRNFDKAVEWLKSALASGADFSRPTPPGGFFAAAPGSKPQDDGAVAGEIETDPVAESQASAHFLLGLIYEKKKDLAGAQAEFVQAATAGTAGRAGIQKAAMLAALNYAFGQGGPRDLVKANEMLTHARTLTKRSSIATLHDYVTMKIVDQFAVADLEENVESASEELQTSLQFQIAETFAARGSKDYNIAEAVKWYELAAENGKDWAMLSLAFIYSRGDLGKPDPEKAFAWFEKAGGGETPKHYLGIADLGICYQNGLGTAKDSAKAEAIFKRYREKDFICYLGSIGRCPDHVLTFEQVLALNELWASKKNDAWAQYFLGLRYWHGNGVEMDDSRGNRLLKKAAKASCATAWDELGHHYQFYPFNSGCNSEKEGFEKAAECYRQGLALGNASSFADLAYLTEFGLGVSEDVDKAADLYERSLQLDPKNDMAHNNLAVILQTRLRNAAKIGLPVDSTTLGEMLRQFEEADRLGDGKAAFNLGGLYRDGVLMEKDLRKAYGYLETAAERGDVESRYLVGLMHEQGEGVPVTYSEAAYHYRLAALEGHEEALRRLVNLYLTGRGVSQDFDRAAFWLERMARNGKVGALIFLGDIALKKGEYDNAVKLFKKLNELPGDAVAGYACERLSRCYLYGWGVKEKPERAKSYFDRAVKLGNPDALYRLAMQTMAAGKTQEALGLFEKATHGSPAASFALGQIYFFGTNVTQDRAKAWRLLRSAAEGGNAEALYFLAATTFNRIPDSPTLDEAIRYAEEAESAGHTKAGSLREKLEKRRRSGDAPAEESTGARPS